MPLFQLMNLDKYGVERPITDIKIPGKPIDPFGEVEDAVAFAEAHPELFPHGRYNVKAVFLIQPKKEATPAPKEEGAPQE